MLFYIIMLPNIWCSFSGLKHCASFVDRFLIKPFLFFFLDWTWYFISSWLFMIRVYMLQPPQMYSFRFVGWLCFLFFLFVVVAAGLFFFPSLYLGNGSEQTNIVIYGTHWFIFVVSKFLFLGSIGLNTTKLDADELDRPIYLGKVVWVTAVAPLAQYMGKSILYQIILRHPYQNPINEKCV